MKSLTSQKSRGSHPPFFKWKSLERRWRFANFLVLTNMLLPASTPKKLNTITPRITHTNKFILLNC